MKNARPNCVKPSPGHVPQFGHHLTEEGQIDWPGLRQQIDFVISTGAKNLVLTYGNSLFSVLTDDEIAEITKETIEQVDKRALVVAATGNWWTGKSVEFAEYCTKLGADMLMVLPPRLGRIDNRKYSCRSLQCNR